MNAWPKAGPNPGGACHAGRTRGPSHGDRPFTDHTYVRADSLGDRDSPADRDSIADHDPAGDAIRCGHADSLYRVGRAARTARCRTASRSVDRTRFWPRIRRRTRI